MKAFVRVAVLLLLFAPLVLFFQVYEDRRVRAQVHAVIAKAEDLRTRLSAYHERHGRWPQSTADVAFDPDFRGAHGSRVRLAESGDILITFAALNDEVAGRRVRLRPVLENGQLARWLCQNLDTPPQYLPGGCR